jgi:hypothetical protein
MMLGWVGCGLAGFHRWVGCGLAGFHLLGCEPPAKPCLSGLSRGDLEALSGRLLAEIAALKDLARQHISGINAALVPTPDLGLLFACWIS